MVIIMQEDKDIHKNIEKTLQNIDNDIGIVSISYNKMKKQKQEFEKQMTDINGKSKNLMVQLYNLINQKINIEQNNDNNTNKTDKIDKQITELKKKINEYDEANEKMKKELEELNKELGTWAYKALLDPHKEINYNNGGNKITKKTRKITKI